MSENQRRKLQSSPVEPEPEPEPEPEQEASAKASRAKAIARASRTGAAELEPAKPEP